MYAESRRKGFNEVVRGRILAGNYFLQREVYDKYFLKALKVRRLVSEDFSRVFQMPVDLLLTPVTLSAAPSFKAFSSADNRTQTTKQDYCTQPVNLAGLPAATVPVTLSSEGLPLSLQVIAPMNGDRLALALCRWIEQRANFPLVNLA
jgi:aspartyl-tRNA(Asn)/glutamyl-tRNA(Gln) amidotransferase subunit A